MNLEFYIERLSENRNAFRSLLRGVSDEQARWKPAPEKWSILEVVNHLYDEEREDFRAHLDALLRDPAAEWKKIDPQGWVASRAYNERDPKESLENFLLEREKSLKWLAELRDPRWENERRRPSGIVSAGDMLASWLAHDFLHIKQLTRLQYDYVARIAAPYGIAYAGEW